jgi:hypothetical protein
MRFVVEHQPAGHLYGSYGYTISLEHDNCYRYPDVGVDCAS